jgi:hypothetical protein
MQANRIGQQTLSPPLYSVTADKIMSARERKTTTRTITKRHATKRPLAVDSSRVAAKRQIRGFKPVAFPGGPQTWFTQTWFNCAGEPNPRLIPASDPLER